MSEDLINWYALPCKYFYIVTSIKYLNMNDIISQYLKNNLMISQKVKDVKSINEAIKGSQMDNDKLINIVG